MPEIIVERYRSWGFQFWIIQRVICVFVMRQMKIPKEGVWNDHQNRTNMPNHNVQTRVFKGGEMHCFMQQCEQKDDADPKWEEG
jgi:hypothetical protein